MNFIDETLTSDLEDINKEAKRRQGAKPVEPYATWKMLAQMAALERFNERSETVGASAPVAMEK